MKKKQIKRDPTIRISCHYDPALKLKLDPALAFLAHRDASETGEFTKPIRDAAGRFTGRLQTVRFSCFDFCQLPAAKRAIDRLFLFPKGMHLDSETCGDKDFLIEFG